MPGNIKGGRKAAATNKERYGSDFYARIGSIGGKHGHTGGFAEDADRAQRAGCIGGKKSRRGFKLVGETETELVYINNKTLEEKRVNKSEIFQEEETL